MTVKFE